MPPPNVLGDPRTGRDRRAPTRTRTFKDGQLDPIITNKRPLLTIGNGILLLVMIGFGLYATGNLPQLDAFFAQADAVGKAHNNVVVNTILTYGTVLFGAILVAVFCLMLFLFINAHRRRESDPKGWHKVERASDRRTSDRRANTSDLPSLVMPLGKSRPSRRVADKSLEPALATDAARESQPPTSSKPPAIPEAVILSVQPAVKVDKAKADAIAAATKAEAALASAPVDLPSFVMPFGKTKPQPKPAGSPSGTRTMQAVAPSQPTNASKVADEPPAISSRLSSPTDTSLLSAAPTNATSEAVIAAAMAASAKAEAAIATAKAEVAIAAAKAEMAIAEATIAAAKAGIRAN